MPGSLICNALGCLQQPILIIYLFFRGNCIVLRASIFRILVFESSMAHFEVGEQFQLLSHVL